MLFFFIFGVRLVIILFLCYIYIMFYIYCILKIFIFIPKLNAIRTLMFRAEHQMDASGVHFIYSVARLALNPIKGISKVYATK